MASLNLTHPDEYEIDWNYWLNSDGAEGSWTPVSFDDPVSAPTAGHNANGDMMEGMTTAAVVGDEAAEPMTSTAPAADNANGTTSVPIISATSTADNADGTTFVPATTTAPTGANANGTVLVPTIPAATAVDNANGTTSVPTTTAAPAEMNGPGRNRLTRALTEMLKGRPEEAYPSPDDSEAAWLYSPCTGSLCDVKLGEALDPRDPKSIEICRAAAEREAAEKRWMAAQGPKRKRSLEERDLAASKHGRANVPAPGPMNRSIPVGEVEGQGRVKETTWNDLFHWYANSTDRAYRLLVQKTVEFRMRAAMNGDLPYPSAEDVRYLSMYGGGDPISAWSRKGNCTMMQYLIDAGANVLIDNTPIPMPTEVAQLTIHPNMRPEDIPRARAGHERQLRDYAAAKAEAENWRPKWAEWEMDEREVIWSTIREQKHAFEEVHGCGRCAKGQKCLSERHSDTDLVPFMERDGCWYHEHRTKEEKRECREQQEQLEASRRAMMPPVAQQEQPGPAQMQTMPVVAHSVGEQAQHGPVQMQTMPAVGEHGPALMRQPIVPHAHPSLPAIGQSGPSQPRHRPVVVHAVEEEDLYTASPRRHPPQPMTQIAYEGYIGPRGAMGIAMLTPPWEGKGKGKAV